MSEVMNAEQRLKLQFGEIIFQLAVVSAADEAKAARIQELEAELAARDLAPIDSTCLST